MDIIGQTPRMSAAMTARAAEPLSLPCGGYDCKNSTARFVRRLISGNVSITIQCQGCGRAVVVLKRAEVYNWEDLPLWDESIRTDWHESKRSEGLNFLRDMEAAQLAREKEAAERRTEYRRWLLTSKEWQTLRDRVWRRAMGQCEACLANRASDIHHVTYRMGRLPPAWELRAVCRSCHDRLHDWTGGEE